MFYLQCERSSCCADVHVTISQHLCWFRHHGINSRCSRHFWHDAMHSLYSCAESTCITMWIWNQSRVRSAATFVRRVKIKADLLAKAQLSCRQLSEAETWIRLRSSIHKKKKENSKGDHFLWSFENFYNYCRLNGWNYFRFLHRIAVSCRCQHKWSSKIVTDTMNLHTVFSNILGWK